MSRRAHPLRAYRLERGLTCKEVGDKLGIAETTVRSYENGNRRISGDMALVIEGALGIPRETTRADLFRRAA